MQARLELRCVPLTSSLPPCPAPKARQAPMLSGTLRAPDGYRPAPPAGCFLCSPQQPPRVLLGGGAMSRGRGRQGSSVVVLETLRKNSQATSIYFENNKFLKTCRLQHYTKYVEIALQMLANSSFLGPADVTPGFLVSWTWCVSSGFAHPRLQSGPPSPTRFPFPWFSIYQVCLSRAFLFPPPSLGHNWMSGRSPPAP